MDGILVFKRRIRRIVDETGEAFNCQERIRWSVGEVDGIFESSGGEQDGAFIGKWRNRAGRYIVQKGDE